jgi:hypothetical protein
MLKQQHQSMDNKGNRQNGSTKIANKKRHPATGVALMEASTAITLLQDPLSAEPRLHLLGAGMLSICFRG